MLNMGKKLTDQGERITQKSIGFSLRQLNFFAKYPDFKPDVYCRDVVDRQIALIDPEFLKKDEKAIN